MRRLGVVAAVSALILAGCATMQVGSYAGRSVDFRPYLTWDWAPADALPTGDPRLDNNAFFTDHLQGAVERHLAMRGYPRAAGTAPDLLVHYHATISQRMAIEAADSRINPCYGDNCLPPRVVTWESGTLVLDIVEARTGRLVWRGWAEDSMEGVLDDQDRMEQQIERAVSRIIARFPPRL
jgi:hypothetical protein